MNKSHLLINEPALQVLPSLAVAIGLEEAIVVQQLHYWLNNPKNDGRIEEGYKWVYNTYETWHDENFPFFSTDKIQRIFLSLEKLGVVISSQFDAKRRDMKKFYRIDYEALCALDSLKSAPSNSLKSESSNTANLHDVKMNQKLQSETTTENDDEALATISKVYISEIGMLTPMIADELREASIAYPLQWTIDAIREAATQNRRGWKYVLAILTRWKAQGNQEVMKRSTTTAMAKEPKGFDAIRQWASKQEDLINGN